MAICNIALHLSRNGQYVDADAVTRFAASQYPHFQQHSQMWKLIDLHVAFYRTLWLSQWDRAEQIASQLGVFDRTESLIKKAHLLLCKGDTSGGKSVLDALDKQLSTSNSSSSSSSSSSNRLSNPGWRLGQRLRLKVQSLMLHAVLLCARQSYAQALSCISQASYICTKHHMTLQLALVSMQSAEIQVYFHAAIVVYLVLYLKRIM